MSQVCRGRPVGQRSQPLPRDVLALDDPDRPLRSRARPGHGEAVRWEVRVEAREMVLCYASVCAARVFAYEMRASPLMCAPPTF